MTKHFEREIERLKRQILALSAQVEENVVKSTKAVQGRNSILAQEVIDTDPSIDQMEVEVEEECLKILALYQPVAHDLRFVVSILKINADLERIGDLAVNIAHRAKKLASLAPVNTHFNIIEMSTSVKHMLRHALEALVNEDIQGARDVILKDTEVDSFNAEIVEVVYSEIQKDPSRSEAYLLILNVARNLERIGDHATNIAEDIIYLVEGEIVRHVIK